MSFFENQELKQMHEPTEEEILEEARAWGCETVEEWLTMMDEAYTKSEE